MKRICHAVFIVAVSCALLAPFAPFAPFAAAAIPGADDPKSFTEHDLRKLKLEYNRRTLRGAYEQVGRKNAAWDEDAGKFLDGVALYFASAHATPRYRLPGGQTAAELAKIGKTVRDTGCDDPLVLYCYAAMLDDAAAAAGKDRAAVKPLVREALEGLAKGPYPPARACAAAGRLLRHLDEKTEAAERERVGDVMREAALRAIISGDFQGLQRRMLWEHVGETLNALPVAEQKLMYEAMLQLPTADEWFVSTFAGHYFADAAWEARGSGWAYTVTDEGWRAFFDHLANARQCLVKAYDIDPRLPEPASEMIRVANGGGDTLGEDPRAWFEKTVAAQFDYEGAYDGLMWSLRPRWGGSHDEMYAFGLECLETKRFDTRVPYQFVVALQDISGDGDTIDFTYWRRPGAYEKLAMAFDAEIALPAHQAVRGAAFYRSYKAAAAWLTGRHKEALSIVQELGDRLDHDLFRRVDALSTRAVVEIHALGGPLGEELAAAERSARQGLRIAALEQLRALKARPKLTNNERRFIHERAIEIEREIAFLNGEWVSIQPTQPKGPMLGWYPQRGQWTVDEQGRLVGTAAASGLSILLAQDFGKQFAWTGTVEFVDPVPTGASGGPIIAHHKYGHYALLLEPGAKQASLRYGREEPQAAPAPVAASNEFEVLFDKGTVTVGINGVRVFDKLQLEYGAVDTRRTRIGVGLVRPVKGTVLRFSNMKVRRLDKHEPEATRPTTGPA